MVVIKSSKYEYAFSPLFIILGRRSNIKDVQNKSIPAILKSLQVWRPSKVLSWALLSIFPLTRMNGMRL